MEYIYYIFGFFLLIWVFTVGQACMRFSLLRLKEIEIELIERDDLPEYLAPVFEAAEKFLFSQGFEYSHSIRFTSMFVHDDLPNYSMIFFHPATQSYADARPGQLPDWHSSFEITYSTFFSDDTSIQTIDCLIHSLPPVPDEFGYSDEFAADPKKQWDLHQKRHNSLKDKDTITISPEKYTEHIRSLSKKLLDIKKKDTWFKPAEKKGLLRLRYKKLFTYARQVTAGNKKRFAAIKTASTVKLSQDQISAKEIADADALYRVIHTHRQLQYGKDAKLVIFGISALLFFIIFGIVFEFDFLFAAILLVVVLIHELGHLIGMILFGYKNRQVMFIPMMGAVTTGREENVKPFHKMIVYLLGPVPGIIIGIACLFLTASTGSIFWLKTSLFFIIINYLNLLPVNPFDGGRIVELLFFSRFPRARFCFWLASTVAFAAGAWAMDDPIMIGISVFLVMALQWHWRFGNAEYQIRKIIKKDAGEKDRLLAICRILARPPYDKFALANKIQTAKTISQHLSSVKPGIATIVAGTLIYGMLLVPPIYIATNYEKSLSYLKTSVRKYMKKENTDTEKELGKIKHRDEIRHRFG
ncbi:site-2 protease family protein [Desulfobacterales bacterium HSG16]|nr:site-2 protease family protein [Desulfobacterales bacterium HSG16]